eukprot:5704112-Prymnesium_polylepis.1
MHTHLLHTHLPPHLQRPSLPIPPQPTYFQPPSPPFPHLTLLTSYDHAPPSPGCERPSPPPAAASPASRAPRALRSLAAPSRDDQPSRALCHIRGGGPPY